MTTQTRLPLFYKKPQVLRFEDHKAMGLVGGQDFSFTAEATAIPLSVSEFMPSIRHYPIVFVGEKEPSPVAIVGLKQGRNLMLEENGGWAAQTYIPAYIRRYPFILVQSPDQDTRYLAYDGESDRVKPLSDAPDAAPIFNDDGTASKAVEPMLHLCEAYHQHRAQDAAFLKAIAEADILVARHVDMDFPDKSRYRLDGFSIIDIERYRALPAKTLKLWTEKGWTDAIALHLASAQNWGLLMERNQRFLKSA
ncbi:SapC family protein [Martelella soudanensis]|uniref:SapC family protein n=1 Tax=unclassified Martelella TaxID=2629616 RepID=UPI0015E0440D|nr:MULTISPECIES: SapC family protein [unclassified Martelella]